MLETSQARHLVLCVYFIRPKHATTDRMSHFRHPKHDIRCCCIFGKPPSTQRTFRHAPRPSSVQPRRGSYTPPLKYVLSLNIMLGTAPPSGARGRWGPWGFEGLRGARCSVVSGCLLLESSSSRGNDSCLLVKRCELNRSDMYTRYSYTMQATCRT